jgi:hypothetical protein
VRVRRVRLNRASNALDGPLGTTSSLRMA